MKKSTLITFVCMLVCLLTVQAGPIDQQKARQLAAQFMQGKGLQLKGEPRRAPGLNEANNTEAQPLYIFNTDGAKGFVIVAGDDRADAILGYSTEGSYDEQNLPDNFRFYLQLLSSDMQALMASDATATTRRAIEIHDAIAPLIQTRWNQGNATADGFIYNTMCPTLSGKHCLTGCVATAGAQIMYYHQYPKSTEGVGGYQADGQYVSINNITVQGLPETSFDWDKMKLSYTASDQGTEEQEEVAKLMLYAGFAAQMKYGTSGSSANPGVLAEGMVKYFGYDPYTCQYIKRASYSVKEWDEIMYNELEKRRPIIYSGQSEVEGGHAFICDGYDGEGLYHFNWGWGGNYDGYFKLSATNPYPGKYNNDGKLYDGFVNDIDAVIGLQPNTGVIPEENTDNIVATARNITIDNTTISMIVANECNEDHKFGFGMGELNSDGSIDVIDNSYEYYKGTVLPAGYSFSEPLTFYFASYNLSEGTHKLVPMCLIAGETEWKRCKPSLVYFEVEVAGDGSMTITQHPTVELEATQIEVPSNKIETLVQQVDVTVESKSDDYQGPLYLFASKTEDKGAYTYLAGTAIDGGASDVVTFYFTPATAGTWNLWIATDEAGNDIIGQGQATAEIGEAPTGEVTLEVSDETLIMEGDEATLTFKITNTGSTPNYRDIPTICWRKNEERPGYLTGEINTITSNTTIEPGETKEYSVTYSGMKDQCWYMIEIYQYSLFSDANYRDNSIAYHEFTFEASTTAITLPEADTTADDTFYTLNGQRMSGRPNKAGIYIHKGKKVIVR